MGTPVGGSTALPSGTTAAQLPVQTTPPAPTPISGNATVYGPKTTQVPEAYDPTKGAAYQRGMIAREFGRELGSPLFLIRPAHRCRCIYSLSYSFSAAVPALPERGQRASATAAAVMGRQIARLIQARVQPSQTSGTTQSVTAISLRAMRGIENPRASSWNRERSVAPSVRRPTAARSTGRENRRRSP